MEQHYRDFLIRPWQPSDRQAVAELAQIVLAEYDMVFDPNQVDYDVIQVETAYWATGGKFWVVERHGTVVGSGGYQPCNRTLEPSDRAVELRKMFLHPDARGQGVGRYLLHRLEIAAANQGFTHIWLETAVRMKTAINLYERNGYQQPSNTGVHVKRCDRVYVKALIAGSSTLI